MKYAEIKDEILEEIPIWLETDPVFRTTLLRMLKDEFLPKKETESRFDSLMADLRRDRETNEKNWREQHQVILNALAELKQLREAQDTKWEEQNRKWDEQNKRLAEENRKWDEQNRKWEEQNRKWDGQNKRLAEENRKWDEQNRKWEEGRKEFDKVHEEIMAMSKKIDRSVGGLGARWGLQSERSFRNALAGILEESFDVKVINENVYDTTGEVFGRPDQVEIDVIIHNGLIIACELKSSMDRADMYVFERKVRFYEKLHNRTVTRMIAISPMISPRALQVAENLGIESFSDSIDVAHLHPLAGEAA